MQRFLFDSAATACVVIIGTVSVLAGVVCVARYVWGLPWN